MSLIVIGGGGGSTARSVADAEGEVHLEALALGDRGWLVTVRRAAGRETARDVAVFVPRPGGYSDDDPWSGAASVGRQWVNEGAGILAEWVSIGSIGWVVTILRTEVGAVGTELRADPGVFVPAEGGDVMSDGPFA